MVQTLLILTIILTLAFLHQYAGRRHYKRKYEDCEIRIEIQKAEFQLAKRKAGYNAADLMGKTNEIQQSLVEESAAHEVTKSQLARMTRKYEYLVESIKERANQ